MTFLIIVGIIVAIGFFLHIKGEREREEQHRRHMSELREKARKFKHLYPSVYSDKFGRIIGELSDNELSSLSYESEDTWKAKEREHDSMLDLAFYKDWKDKQTKFSKICIDLQKSLAPNWGRYFYDIERERTLPNSKKHKVEINIWEFFTKSFCCDASLDYSLAKYIQDDTLGLYTYKKCEKKLPNSYYDLIISYLAEVAKTQDKITIVYADSGMGDNAKTFNDFHLGYIQNKLSDIYDHVDIKDFLHNPYEYRSSSIVIIEFIANNERLIKNCQTIINGKEIKDPLVFANIGGRDISETIDRYYGRPHYVMHHHKSSFELLPSTPAIIYIALFKEYSSAEMQSIIRKLEEDKQKKEEKARLEAIEALKREQERLEIERREQERIRKEAEEKERRRTAGSRLKQCTNKWYCPNKANLKCYSMYYYYPTTCEFSASQTDWDIRNLIWDFKANPNKPMSIETIIELHENATNEIVDDMSTCLNHFFSDDVKYLTLVCVPSSKDIIHKRRFQDFSEQICRKTSMENGFDYIHVTSDGDAKHMGGVSSSSYEVDSEFFNGKHVLIFDDVITSGRSMERLRITLQNAGANVIGGFSIGKTKHEKQGNHPFYILGEETSETPLDDLPF